MSLYVKNCFPHKQLIYLAKNYTIFESIFIEIDKKEFETNKHIIIGLIYKPTNASVKQFNEKLKKTGFSHSNWKKLTSKIKTFISFYYLTITNKLITVPTRIDERTKTSSLIDTIYIPESDTDMTGVLKTRISDNHSIFHARKNSNMIIDNQYRVKRNFS